MADTDINAATLTVTITEALEVGHDTSADGRDFAQTLTHTFASIANVSKRVLKLGNTISAPNAVDSITVHDT